MRDLIKFEQVNANLEVAIPTVYSFHSLSAYNTSEMANLYMVERELFRSVLTSTNTKNASIHRYVQTYYTSRIHCYSVDFNVKVSSLRDRDVATSGRVVSFAGQDLVVMVRAEPHTSVSPCLEVSSDIDASSSTLVLADRPVLLEGLGTVDRRLIDTSALSQSVGGSIDGDGSLVRGSAGWVV